MQVRDDVEATDTSGSPSVPLEQSTSGLAKLWISLGIVFAIVALAFLPPIFCGLGILFGYLARRSGSQAAGVATMWISGIAMALGIAVGVLLVLLG